jgi:DNA-directed RNA polymerase subunit RPC12/RpoP
MAFHKITADGPDPQLKKGEYLSCKGCGTVFNPSDVSRLWDQTSAKARCPECGTFGQFLKHRPTGSKALRGRWGGIVISRGWSAVPEVLLRHQGLLKLSATDLAVLLQLELHRRNAADVVWPGLRTVARRSGLGERTVRERIQGLEERGLIEVQNAERSGGGTTSNRYLANGLREALALIASNEVAQLAPEHGLEALLGRLERAGRVARSARIP